MCEKIYNENLSKHTTFKIGGPAKVLSIPKNLNEFINEIKYCLNNNIKFKILGNGSNILVNDKGFDGYIIKNKKALNYIHKNNNLITVGSSVMLPKFVNYCVNNNLEGMEYLYSIPGTIGGAIYMNAGRGMYSNKFISNKIKKIKVFNGNKCFYISKQKADFKYRKSIFHKKKNWIIIEAIFKLNKQSKEIGKNKIKERMNYVKKHQIRNLPSAGSIYKEGHSHKLLKLISLIKFSECKFNGNWITNYGDAKAKDIITLIKISNTIHKIFLKKPELEIEIW